MLAIAIRVQSIVEINVPGRVLDVSCGTWGRPYDLEANPAELGPAIDPVPMNGPPDFEFLRGIHEALPWPEAAFSRVIHAVSIDHTLSADGGLAEIRQLLCPSGALILWLASSRDPHVYGLTSATFHPADRSTDFTLIVPGLIACWQIISPPVNRSNSRQELCTRLLCLAGARVKDFGFRAKISKTLLD